ncbi:MAG: LemA family protein, partial [Salinivenus sp.]
EADLVFSEYVDRGDDLYYDKGPKEEVDDSLGRRRFKEWVIPNKDDVYVIGDADLREDAVEPEIVEDETAPMFLISSKSEETLVQKYGRQTLLAFVFSIVFGAGAPGIFVLTGGVTAPFGVHYGVWMAGIALLILVLIGLAYVRTIYNGLVDLRNREDRAWAMLDVEFQRRADLIPNLAAVVQSVAAHEKEIQEEVAEAVPSESLGESASDADPKQAEKALQKQSGALTRVVGLAEDYPEIKSDEHFQELMDALTHCEDRIELAKRFYNNSVERLNNRVDTVPDTYVAPLAGAETEDYLSLEDFEKTSVDVDRGTGDAQENPAVR